MAGTTNGRVARAVAWADRTELRGRRLLGGRPVRLAWLGAGSLAAVALLLAGGVQAASVLAREDRTEVTEVEAAGLEHLAVDNDAGSVTVIGVAGADSVTVRARVRDGLRPTGHEVDRQGDRLDVRATCPLFGSQWCAVHYTVEVPVGLAVAVSSRDSVAVSDVTGGVVATARRSGVRLARVGGDVSIESDHGRLQATDLTAGRVTARSDQGSIELEFAASPDEIVVEADQGSVTVVLPDEADVAYATDTDTDQGTVSDAIRQDPSAPRSITVGTDQGDITISYATS